MNALNKKTVCVYVRVCVCMHQGLINQRHVTQNKKHTYFSD